MLLPDPFDEFDPHHSMNSKKAFDETKIRCLQTRINLKMKYEELRRKKPKPPTYTQRDVVDFDKLCT